ncbi:MAG: cytidylate kinase family protein [Candidatus Nanohaloarchaea archaeon]
MSDYFPGLSENDIILALEARNDLGLKFSYEEIFDYGNLSGLKRLYNQDLIEKVEDSNYRFSEKMIDSFESIKPLYFEHPELFKTFNSMEMPQNPSLITVSGLNGVGTSTISEYLGQRTGFQVVSSGDIFRDLAEDYDMTINELMENQEQVEKEEGIDLDIEADRRVLREAATETETIFEGRMTGTILKDIAPVRILVQCDLETAAERLREREGIESLEAARELLESRRAASLDRYRDKYGVDPREPSYYNVVVDNTDSLEDVKRDLDENIRDMEESISEDFIQT